MKWLLLALICVASLCGCGKPKAVPGGGPGATNAVSQAVPDQKPLEGLVHPQLTFALKSFVQEKGRLPQNLLELKNTKLDSMPRPPDGFMYAIDPVTVEVKMVKQ